MTITMNDGRVVLHHGDSRDVLRELADCSIDSVVTDPPYALVSIQKRFSKTGRTESTASKSDAHQRFARGFMGKTWDTEETAFAEAFWAEILRVLKPGGHVLAFGGTRTYHRLVCAIEDAGFEIRDQIGWAYGSGFPKSHNQKDEWEGWGTALKPAWEPICLARKPLSVPVVEVRDVDVPVRMRTATVAENLREYGTGALNIDGCRVSGEPWKAHTATGLAKTKFFTDGEATVIDKEPHDLGRWPANLIHDGSEEVIAAFPDAPGQQSKSNDSQLTHANNVYGAASDNGKEYEPRLEVDKSAARFFYCAKASKADRDQGLDGFVEKTVGDGRAVAADNAYQRGKTERKNTHPTVKPTELMRYLCRLITPPGGVVLDPFMGSGSTGKAAVLEGFRFVGIEREDEYVPIAEGRIRWAVENKDGPAKPKPAKPANDNTATPATATTTADLFSAAPATPVAGAA